MTALCGLLDQSATEIVRPLILKYLSRKETRELCENAHKHRRDIIERNRRRGRERWAASTHNNINVLIGRYDKVDKPDPEDFIMAWELETERKFTRRVFNFVMQCTELKYFYDGCTAEDFGFSPRIQKQKVRRIRRSALRKPERVNHSGIPFHPNLKIGDSVEVSWQGPAFTDTVLKINKRFITLKLENHPDWNPRFHRDTGENVKTIMHSIIPNTEYLAELEKQRTDWFDKSSGQESVSPPAS